MAGSKVGGLRRIASQNGLSLDEFVAREGAGLKWCYGCDAWHARPEFSADRTRRDGLSVLCRKKRNEWNRARYVPRPKTRSGPPPAPPRDGDKRQARQRINVLVRTGRLPHPNTAPCIDCGHYWAPGERRHEYDHVRGYDGANHYRVEVVCSRCHHKRTAGAAPAPPRPSGRRI